MFMKRKSSGPVPEKKYKGRAAELLSDRRPESDSPFESGLSEVESWNMITLFVILVLGLAAASVLCPVREYSETENRTLAQMPRFTAETVFDGSFESDYETFLTDQFILRDSWIGLKTAVERAAFRQESKDVYFAADDFLIEKHSGTFTSETAVTNQSVLPQFVQRYKDLFPGRMTVMVVPNAVSVMRDHLPLFASPYNETEYLDQMRGEIPDDIWFDAEEILKERYRAGYEDFYRTDHHWRTQAAFAVYRDWAKTQDWAEDRSWEIPKESDYSIETVTDQFLGTIQSRLGIRTRADSIEVYLPLGDPFYTVQRENAEPVYSVYNMPSLETKDKYGVFFGGNTALVKIRTKADPSRKLLVIKDSYANCFVPFLIRDFGAIDMLDVRYYNQLVSELIRNGEYTDCLFLYNAAGFAEDAALGRILL